MHAGVCRVLLISFFSRGAVDCTRVFIGLFGTEFFLYCKRGGGDTLPPFRVCLFQKLGSLFSTSRVLFGVRGGVELEGHGEVARMLCSLLVPRRWLSLTLVYQARGLFPKKEILHIF